MFYHLGVSSPVGAAERSDPVASHRPALARAHEAVAAVAAMDDAAFDACTGDALAEALVALEALRRVLDGAEARLLAAVDRRDWTDVEGGLRTAPWLAAVAGLPRGVANGRVRVARALHEHFPLVAEALAAGRVGWDHAAAIVRVANPRNREALAAAQEVILDDAEGTVFEAWKRTLDEVARLADADGPPPDDLTRNRVSISPLCDGDVRIDGTLVGTAAHATRQAVDARADEIRRRFQRDQAVDPTVVMPARPTLRALALMELVTGTQPSEAHLDPGDEPDADPSPPGPVRPARPEISLLAHADHPWALATPDGVGLHDALAAAIACDADWHPVVVDSLGVPLAAGRTIRHASRAQRRALAVRDGGCTFPGCGVPPEWCDAHHLVRWSAGGSTDVTSLCLLCRHHHTVTHRRGWTATIDDAGWITWTTPTGAILHSQRHHRRRPNPHRRRGRYDPPTPLVISARGAP